MMVNVDNVGRMLSIYLEHLGTICMDYTYYTYYTYQFVSQILPDG